MSLNEVINNHQLFSDRILSEIQKMPFGSLPKLELELVILDALIKTLEPIDSYSNIEKHFSFLRRELKLSQSQLKNRILAAQLRFDFINDDDIENCILNSIQTKKYSIEGQYIIIKIFNPLLNDLTKSYLEIKGIISDTSFNKSIVKINLTGFIKFLINLSRLSDSTRKELIQILNSEKEQHEIKYSIELPKQSLIEKIESITFSGSNIVNIIEKFIPLISKLL
jgi:hypothetical protein